MGRFVRRKGVLGGMKMVSSPGQEKLSGWPAGLEEHCSG